MCRDRGSFSAYYSIVLEYDINRSMLGYQILVITSFYHHYESDSTRWLAVNYQIASTFVKDTVQIYTPEMFRFWSGGAVLADPGLQPWGNRCNIFACVCGGV